MGENACKDKECPKRHPKRCRYLEECRFQSQCSYRHEKEGVIINEKTNLLEIIKNLKSRIFTLKQENNDEINILPKVHLKELLDMKEKNTELQNKVNNLKVQLAARDEEVAEAVVSDTSETPQLIVTFVSSKQNRDVA